MAWGLRQHTQQQLLCMQNQAEKFSEAKGAVNHTPQLHQLVCLVVQMLAVLMHHSPALNT